MKTLLTLFVAVLSLAWATAALAPGAEITTSLPWIARQEGLYLSGLLSIGLMSLAMVLAVRPAWLERPLGGLDRAYRVHKWAGILAIALAATHWLVEMSDDIIKNIWGKAGKPDNEHVTGVLAGLQDLAEEFGEWAIYAVLAMLVLSLWKRFPYAWWRHAHRIMPVLYLMLAFHAALLAPATYWTQPVGALLALLLSAGTIASIISLTGRIAHKRQFGAEIVSVSSPAPDITEVRCRLASPHFTHKPGQFAFVTFDTLEGAHPFTIASADQGDGLLSFQIKGLGDYTRKLAQRLSTGQKLSIEGPYGHFSPDRLDRNAQQRWVAAGIGVTPFIAWLESLSNAPADAPPARLHYLVRDERNDPFVERLRALCSVLPSIELHIHDTGSGNRPDADSLIGRANNVEKLEVWFCGPQGLGAQIRSALERHFPTKGRFHQELFEMR